MYVHLTREDADVLRAERALALEVDHYRKTLLFAELPADAPARQRDALLAELAELERRATLYLPRTEPVAMEEGEPPAA